MKKFIQRNTAAAKTAGLALTLIASFLVPVLERGADNTLHKEKIAERWRDVQDELEVLRDKIGELEKQKPKNRK